MKTTRAVLLIALFLVAAAAFAATQSALSDFKSSDRLPGVDLTEGISQVTGVAISPMLGVSAIGAWRYFRTPESQRHRLPWFCHPAVWGVGFFLLSLCLIKDVFGAAAPVLIKKPLDMAELFESKLSALAASVAFLPFLASQIAEHLGDGQHALLDAPAAVHYASVLPTQLMSSDLGVYLMVLPLCIAAFLVVWLTAHCVNVLIAISPFGFIDATLKLAKTFLLSIVVVSYAISPYFGAAIALCIIGIAAVLAPWAFRLTVFGTVLATDVILPRRARRHATADEPHAFLARRLNGVPVRTFGRLTRGADGVTRLEYRPWLIFARRSIDIPLGYLSISRGVFFPSLIYTAEGVAFTLATFPPRYRGLEAAIAAQFEVGDVHDGMFASGLKAVRAWLGNTIEWGGDKSRALPDAAAK